MTVLFWGIVGGLIVAALLFVLVPLGWFGRSPQQAAITRTETATPPDEQRQTAVAVYKAQLAELEADLAQGNLSQAQFESAQLDLQRNLLEMSGESTTATPSQRRSWRLPTALVVVLVVPILAMLIYEHEGSGEAGLNPVTQAPAGSASGMQPNVEAAIQGLIARLEQNPDSPQEWALLGRSFLFLGELRPAAGAFAQAIRHGGGQDPDILVSYADVLGSIDGGDLNARALPHIERALEIDPNHIDARWLAGLAAYRAENYAQAQYHWEQLVGRFPPDSDESRIIRSQLQTIAGHLQPQDSPPAIPDPGDVDDPTVDNY